MSSNQLPPLTIKAIIGLGNPGKKYEKTRHNIGFRILDALAHTHNASWQAKDSMEIAEIILNNQKIILLKPQTFMNSSGKVIPFLLKQGIKAENILVVHDELELPCGNTKPRFGGSARGHNGLKSIIEYCGQDFARLRFGIGRPEIKDEVPDYVLSNFAKSDQEIKRCIDDAVAVIEKMIGQE